jgi:hypothetical protein
MCGWIFEATFLIWCKPVNHPNNLIWHCWWVSKSEVKEAETSIIVHASERNISPLPQYWIRCIHLASRGVNPCLCLDFRRLGEKLHNTSCRLSRPLSSPLEHSPSSPPCRDRFLLRPHLRHPLELSGAAESPAESEERLVEENEDDCVKSDDADNGEPSDGGAIWSRQKPL